MAFQIFALFDKFVDNINVISSDKIDNLDFLTQENFDFQYWIITKRILGGKSNQIFFKYLF